ncbi:unnamed protein product [Musa acuminata subsp. malaccensis]|uniref:(wild Malaysian banana) hypothetical protein n=1 Tax=Musa acuminata subsp. malaccensis TaxID=214687 RepID=A0A804K6U3_MUSAM|nr:PREDICTED: MAR-binding filament-like protein 1-1 [Musa acuminata subsp. malaccensis]CAG1831541.1 unnamed protein product [Musa acuminata subsp. malaccensis]
MGDLKNSSSPGSDRRQWQRIFGALVEMVRTQQSQIETLANDRKFLERYIQIQHDRWASKAGFLEAHISQMKEEEKKGRRVQATKLDLMLGMKQREALRYKKQFDQAENDLEDFHAYVEALIAEIAELKEKLKNLEAGGVKSGAGYSKSAENSEGHKNSAVDLEGEIRKLKHSYKNLSLKKEAEISALLAEKNFVWNQLNKMESDYIVLLKTKQIEITKAAEDMQKLHSNLENLQSSIIEKGEIITRLEAERTRLELDLRRYTDEAEKTSNEKEKLHLIVENLQLLIKEKDETIEALKSNLAMVEQNVTGCCNRTSRFFIEKGSQRKPRAAVATPQGTRSKRGSGKSSSLCSEVNKMKKQRSAYEASPGSHASVSTKRLQRCSREKWKKSMSAGSPRLFSSSFKVPKLKSTSPRIS